MISDRNLYEQSPALLFAVDCKDRILVISDRWLSKLNYSKETVVDHSWRDFLTPECREKLLPDSSLVTLRGRMPQPYLDFQTAQGAHIKVEFSASVKHDLAGQTYTLLSLIDITDSLQEQEILRQKLAHLEQLLNDRDDELTRSHRQLRLETDRRQQLEASLFHQEKIYQTSFNAAPVGIVHTNLDCRFERVNPRFYNMLGYSAAELSTLTIADVTHPDDRLIHRSAYAQLLAGDIESFTVEKRYIRHDGTALWGNTTLSIVRDDAEQPLFVIAIVEDISDRKAAQLAQQETEQRFQLIANGISDTFWIDDVQTQQPIYISPHFEEVWGISRSEIEHGFAPLLKIVHPKDRDAFQQHLATNFSRSRSTEFEFRIEHPMSQTVRWLSKRSFPVLDKEGELKQIVGITSDITDRKIAELALAQSEERFRLIAENIRDVFWLTTLTEGKLQNLYVNPAFERIWQMPASTLGKDPVAFMERIHPDDRERFRAALSYSFEHAVDFQVEYRLLLPDGTVRWICDRGSSVFDASQNPVAFAGVAIDVTHQKAIEQSLRQYESLIESNPDPVCLINDDYTYRFANQSFLNWFVFDFDIVGSPIIDCVGEDFFETIAKPRIDRALAGETQYYEEWAYNPNQAESQFISITYTPYYEPDGTISGVINAIRNLTVLKRTRDRLASTTERLRLHIENSPLAAIEWDSDLRVQSWSTQAETIFGLSAAEVLGRHFSEVGIFPPDDLEKIQLHVNKLVRHPRHHETARVHNLNQRGERLCCEWYNSVLTDEAGNLISILSLVQDITERYQTQIALQESRERWQLALSGSNDGIWDWKISNDEVTVSPRYLQMLGFSEDDNPNVTPDVFYDQIHPEDLDFVQTQLEEHLSGRSEHYIAEYRIRQQSGEYIWVLSRGKAVFDGTGTPVRCVGSCSDISDRKQAEIALRSSQQLLQMVFDNMPQRVFWKDLNGRFLGCNPAFAADMGYASPAEILGKTDHELLSHHPESIQAFQKQDQEVVEHDQARFFEGESYHHHDGSSRWLSACKLPLKDFEGKILGVFSSYEDITDRISARQSLQRYARMVEAATDGICLTDRDHRYQMINPTYRSWYGYGDQPILGQTVAEVLGHEAFENRLRPLLERSFAGETITYTRWFEFPHLGRRFRSVTISPYREDTGEITASVTSIRDLTSLKQSEERQQELFEIIEATPNFVGIASPEGEIYYLNPAFQDVMVSASEELKTFLHIRDFHPQWATDKILNEALPTAKQQGTWCGETALITSKEHTIPISQTVTVHRDEYGKVKFYSTIAHDIRPQKSLEQKLRTRLKFEQLLNRVSAAFVDLAGQQIIQGLHQALQDLAKTIGADTGEVFLLSDDQRYQTCLSQWQIEQNTVSSSLSEAVPVDLTHQCLDELCRHRVVITNDLMPIPLEENDLSSSTRTDAPLMVLVPMYRSQTLLGYIQLTTAFSKVWSSNEITFLNLIGDLFANVYQRYQAEEALKRQEQYFRSLVEGTASVTGEEFFPVLAYHLAKSLEVNHILINQLEVDNRLSTVVSWSEAEIQPSMTYGISNTPCQRTLADGFYYCPENVQEVFPDDLDLVMLDADSYLGVAMISESGNVIGEICAVHNQPIPHLENAIALLRIFAARAGAELERQLAETALHKSEALNRAIVEALPDLLIRMTKDGLCLNAQFPQGFRVLRPNMIGLNIRDILPLNLAEQRLQSAERAISMQQTQVSEYEIPVNGRSCWEESRIVPLNETEVLVLVRDVDERRRAENEVRRLNQMLETQNRHLEALVELRTAELMTFMNALPEQIFVVDRATNKMTFGNDAVVAFSSADSRQEYESKAVFDCFPFELASQFDAQNQEVFSTGEILHIEESAETSQGTVHMDTYKIPLKRPNGEVYALIGSSRNITELVKARQTLEAQAIQLEATNQELQAFSYSVSHDLRAPLRHINGFIEALRQRLTATEALTDPKIQHYLDVIGNSSLKMGDLIDGLLLLSRVSRRELVLRPVPLNPLVEEAIRLIEYSSERPEDQLRITVEPLPTVQGDANLLQQVFTNLLDNAVKFSHGRVLAKIRIGQRQDGSFFVQDNGVGFNRVYSDKLFSPFQRLHKQETFKGTGIGLAIVCRIIHRHGGTIWAESEVNQGATFIFTLPSSQE